MNKEELKKELQTIVERIHMDGWEKGKEQCKTPYNFTLTNSDWLEKQWQKILDLFYGLEQVITEEDIIEVLKANDVHMSEYEYTDALDEDTFRKQIASEILSKPKWEVVAEGKVFSQTEDYEQFCVLENPTGNFDLVKVINKCEGKNIKVAISKIKQNQ